MRVSSLQISSTMMNNINSYSSSLNKLTEQMAMQKKVLRPSDDPIASTRLILLNREQASITQFQENITRVSGSLGQQEAQMDAMSKQLLAIRDKVLSANNETTNTSDLSGYGNELNSLLDSVVSVLNTKNEDGRYMFAGTATDTKPVVFDEASGKYVFQANNNQREVNVGNGVTVKENIGAGDLFFNGSNDLLNELNELVGMMQDPDTDFTSDEYKNAVENLISSTDKSIDSISSTITTMGGRQNTLTMMGDAHTDVKLSNQLVIKDLSDLDYAQASIDLNGYMLAATASQSTYVKISQLSLFDAIR